MKQTAVQINEATSIYHETGVGGQIKRHDDLGRVDANLPSGTATVRAVGHEGHVMPMPPAVKPVKENIKPKTPPTPPVAKPPVKKAQSRLRAIRSCGGIWYAPTISGWHCPTSARI